MELILLLLLSVSSPSFSLLLFLFVFISLPVVVVAFCSNGCHFLGTCYMPGTVPGDLQTLFYLIPSELPPGGGSGVKHYYIQYVYFLRDKETEVQTN